MAIFWVGLGVVLAIGAIMIGGFFAVIQILGPR